jgi:hypothetical protein
VMAPTSTGRSRFSRVLLWAVEHVERHGGVFLDLVIFAPGARLRWEMSHGGSIFFTGRESEQMALQNCP